MANKPIKHTELDTAIRNNLLALEGKTAVEWDDIERMLPKKSSSVKSPLPGVKFSLNSFSGLLATGQTVNFKSALLLAKKWSVALYLVGGTLIIGTGSYWIYNAVSSSGNSKAITTPVTQTKPEVKSLENKTSQPTENGLANQTGSSQQIHNDSVTNPGAEVSSIVVSENPDVDGEPLLKTKAPYEKAPSAEEPIQLKTSDPAQSDGFNFANEEVKPDSTNEGGAKSTDSKRVLYYKESLSLDKLEQQMSTNPDEVKQEINTGNSNQETEKKPAEIKKRHKRPAK